MEKKADLGHQVFQKCQTVPSLPGAYEQNISIKEEFSAPRNVGEQKLLLIYVKNLMFLLTTLATVLGTALRGVSEEEKVALITLFHSVLPLNNHHTIEECRSCLEITFL